MNFYQGQRCKFHPCLYEGLSGQDAEACHEAHQDQGGAPLHFELDGEACHVNSLRACRPLVPEDEGVCRAALVEETQLHAGVGYAECCEALVHEAAPL